MKASIKFRDEQMPLMRAKTPINIRNFPFLSGVVAGESKEFSLDLRTYFESGPSLKLSFRPNDSDNPVSFTLKTGTGPYGSPIRSPLTMSAEFNVLGSQNPSFFLRFKNDFGDFSVNRVISSVIVKKLGGKPSIDFSNFNWLFPAKPESKATAALMANGAVRGTELAVTTVVPLRESAVVNFRWGLRAHRRKGYDAGEVRWSGYRPPQFVMNKIGIEHLANAHSKTGSEECAKLAGACLDVKKELEVIQAEKGVLSAGNMEIMTEDHRN